MKIWAYTLAYQEAELIAYWVRHYRQFCEKVIVYCDVDSTDDTDFIAAQEGAEVRPWIGNGLDDSTFSHFASAAYHESDGVADWVIWTDADELLYHQDVPHKLAELEQNGINVPYVHYYVMASPGLPTHPGQIYDQPGFRKGLFVSDDGKLAVFNPRTVRIQWGVGKHLADATEGTVSRGEKDADNNLKILHYRWLGEDYFRKRNARNYARFSLLQHSRPGMGFHVKPDFIGPYDKDWPEAGPEDAQPVI